MFNTKVLVTLGLLLATIVTAQDQTCGATVSSNGGRKIAIVVDSSGSMSSTDPQDLRITAGKSLAASLVTTGGSPDQVTVVDFDSSAAIIYPLGSPSGAGPSFDTIDSSGGTSIYSGIKLALDELTKGNAPTAGVAGIVVLTDGEDSSVTLLVAELVRAKGLGVRVSFGFLSPDSSPSSPSVLSAILDTGGVFSTFQDSEALKTFISSVVSHGLTSSESSASGSVLLPGLTIVGNVSSTAAASYTYSAIAGEALNFTVKALSSQSLSVKLADKGASKDIDTQSTDATGSAGILFTAAGAANLELSVSTTNATSDTWKQWEENNRSFVLAHDHVKLIVYSRGQGKCNARGLCLILRPGLVHHRR
ncbi:putative Calcium-activated chloride channel regulator 4 [Glarea lozoyensis 74030]|uniref:Putative Calcium-activated chloride channel regulator 4 n=1 Tax=Glarea lozoyensis (strain ATCC 74030 / MF5533) TaxID=1104152 RepID=H0ET71_GLAL7|nr:putative Calcium-activated chloride channel regulator 4 [Glarea lozoyensis 74030]